MSLVHLPNSKKGASPEQSTVHNMLVENGQLIETIAEYQKMGRIEDAMKYQVSVYFSFVYNNVFTHFLSSFRFQELLHRNILYLAKLAEPELATQLQQV
jgi:hypothetical protein